MFVYTSYFHRQKDIRGKKCIVYIAIKYLSVSLKCNLKGNAKSWLLDLCCSSMLNRNLRSRL